MTLTIYLPPQLIFHNLLNSLLVPSNMQYNFYVKKFFGNILEKNYHNHFILCLLSFLWFPKSNSNSDVIPEKKKVSLRAVMVFRETKVKPYYCLHNETGETDRKFIKQFGISVHCFSSSCFT
jgi:hypothetical protein